MGAKFFQIQGQRLPKYLYLFPTFETRGYQKLTFEEQRGHPDKNILVPPFFIPHTLNNWPFY